MITEIKTDGVFKMRCMVHEPVIEITLPKYPLIVFLHGRGERSDTNLSLVMRYGPLKQMQDGVVLPFPFIGVSPQLSIKKSKWEVGMIREVIEHMRDKYPVDTDRIYLIGVSLGGWGTWEFITDFNFNSLIAAAVIICGGVGPRGKEAEIVKAKIPLWCAHAKNDTVVPYSVSFDAVQKINAIAGYEQARLTRWGLGGHGIWNKFLDPEQGVYDWLKFQSLTSRHVENKLSAAMVILEETMTKLKAL